MFSKIIKASAKYYAQKLAIKGPSPEGVDWKDGKSQNLRFHILVQVDSLAGKSIHDVGCGLGHLVDFLKERAINCHYVGSDISHEMIHEARQRLPHVHFYIGDILNQTEDWMKADYILASGLFYVKGRTSNRYWWKFVQSMIERMYQLAKYGIAFNMMTSYVDFKAPHLFYLSPETMMKYCCNQLSPRVTIRHDYPLYEYTVYVYKKK
ncbi:MAG TPA: class I SAM-dependent methyltransferase [Deltaproteobacteria bacterium]|nr:class I SAM-dependent methyltransferase [Deltaproteobacteria bacterium]